MLSDKPSEALRQALEDLASCERDPRYKIDMNEWIYHKSGFCEVCLAGATIVQEHGPVRDWVGYTDYRHYGIDQFRVGRLWNGVATFINKERTGALGRAKRVEGIPEYFPVEHYENSPTQFRTDMLQVITMLEAVGL